MSHRLCRRHRILLAAVSFAICIAPPLLADDSRLGWHEEQMPPGLERSDVEGEYLWLKDQSIMVYVPAGPFPYGDDSERAEVDEKPQRMIHLDAFYIDKHEASWRQWRLSGLPMVKDLNGKAITDDKPIWGRADDMPVSYVEWGEAKSYGDWVGKRLPTEAEWEKAAGGTDGRWYPWGDEEPSFDHAVWRDHPIGKDEPAPVTCCERGASPYGALNMAGNVFEWCEDRYYSRFYKEAAERNPINLEKGDKYVLRGGAFVLMARDLRVGLRNRQYAEEGQDYVGFRLVLPAASE